MKPFTEEQMALLKTIEPRLQQAQHDYLTSLFEDQKRMVEEIYKANGGEKGIVWGCGRCWLAVCKEMGEQYLKQLAEAPKTEEKQPAKAKAAPKKKPAKKAE